MASMSDDSIRRFLKGASHFHFPLVVGAACDAHPLSCNIRTLRADIRESYVHKQRRRCKLCCMDLSDSLGQGILLSIGEVADMLDLVKGHLYVRKGFPGFRDAANIAIPPCDCQQTGSKHLVSKRQMN